MGLGRYAQAETVLDEGAAGDPDPQRPAYDYQFVLDCGFLDGRYGDTLARVNRLPDWVKVARPELAVTAMWSAIDAGDPLAFEHYISGTAMNKMAFEPDLFSGLSRFVAGDYGGAEVIFRAMQSSEYGARISDPGR